MWIVVATHFTTVIAFPSKLDIQRVRKVMLEEEQVITFW